MNLFRIYRSPYGDKYSFAIPPIDSLRRSKDAQRYYGVLEHAYDSSFKKLNYILISRLNLITAIEDSFKDNTLELVPLKGK